ncbi:MAG: hypothetical protein IPJ41_04070 [Phycisphaerales bacterium]|nr:hypothetical protein [Phycisphaerales bacterium]
MRKLSTLLVLCALGQAAGAQVVINEVFENPPGGNDEFWEFVEFYGPAGMSLDGYAIALVKGGDDPNGDGIPDLPSEIDEAFTLDGLHLGANGLLVLLNDTGGGNFGEELVDPDTTIAYFTQQHIPTIDTAGKLGNDDSSTYVLLRRRPQTNSDGYPSAWRKDVDPDENWDSHIDFGAPHQSYGHILEPYQMVDNLAWSDNGGKEYVRESDDEISDTPGFNPDAVSRVGYNGVNPGPQPRRADEELVYGDCVAGDILPYDAVRSGGPTGFDRTGFAVTPGSFNDSDIESQFRFVPGDVDFDGRVTAADLCAAASLLGATLDDTEPRVSDNETPDDPSDDFTFDAWKYEGRAFNSLLVTLSANPGDGDAVTLADVAAIKGMICIADWNSDGTVNTQDFIVYLNAWAAKKPCADVNTDGVVNTQDFIAFLNAWTAGC